MNQALTPKIIFLTLVSHSKDYLLNPVLTHSYVPMRLSMMIPELLASSQLTMQRSWKDYACELLLTGELWWATQLWFAYGLCLPSWEWERSPGRNSKGQRARYEEVWYLKLGRGGGKGCAHRQRLGGHRKARRTCTEVRNREDFKKTQQSF